jgi:uncharacterized protein YbaR (Trm112 family)
VGGAYINKIRLKIHSGWRKRQSFYIAEVLFGNLPRMIVRVTIPSVLSISVFWEHAVCLKFTDRKGNKLQPEQMGSCGNENDVYPIELHIPFLLQSATQKHGVDVSQNVLI